MELSVDENRWARIWNAATEYPQGAIGSRTRLCLPAPFRQEPQVDPWGPLGKDRRDGRVVRGGSCWGDAGRARAAFRFLRFPSDEDENRGFRVVLPPGPD
jgi:formylglycine-generating enzyme required for sulfatase activity